ncbi:TetR family transcriptional regulator [Streptomyces sp. NPDC003011]
MARRPVQQRSREKYEAILLAAAELFAEQGFSTTVEQILERAGGLSRGSLYQFWRDKEDLAHTVVTDAYVTDAIRPGKTYLQGVVDASILLAELTVYVPLVRAATRLATEQGKPFFGHLWKLYIPLVTDIIEEARVRGELLPGVVPQEVSELWVDSWNGRDVRHREDYHELPQAIARLNKQVVRGIATPETLMDLDLTVERAQILIPDSRQAEAYYKARRHAEAGATA